MQFNLGAQYLTLFMTLLLSLGLQGCSVFGIRSVEEARYQVVAKDGPIEVRRYEKVMTVATSVMATSFDEATDVTFNRLFDYITGDNVQKQDVSMTAPVMSSQAGEKIEMTSPVLSHISKSNGLTEWYLAFVLPADYEKANVPVPNNPAVSIVEQSEKLVAVLSFSGLWDQQRFDSQSQKLENWIVENGYTSKGSSFFAGYDPPWTLPFLRRNEVMIDVSGLRGTEK